MLRASAKMGEVKMCQQSLGFCRGGVGVWRGECRVRITVEDGQVDGPVIFLERNFLGGD